MTHPGYDPHLVSHRPSDGKSEGKTIACHRSDLRPGACDLRRGLRELRIVLGDENAGNE